jgi:hypothetical protein
MFETLNPALRIDLRDACDAEWTRLGSPGTWWTGPERLALAEQVRLAGRCQLCTQRRASLSPAGDGGLHPATEVLPAAAVEAVHRIASDPGRLTAAWYRDSLAGGMNEGQFVELVGIVAATVFVDTLARGLGVDAPALPPPAPGEPTRTTPPGARVHSGWVPTVDPELAEGEIAALYGLLKVSPFIPNRPDEIGVVPNVTRALTLVPPEQMGFAGFIVAAYFGAQAITEGQEQLLASTVSSVNNCFY